MYQIPPDAKQLFNDSGNPSLKKDQKTPITRYGKLCRYVKVCGKVASGVWRMLVGYMRVSSESDRQSTDLQRDALIAAGIDARHLFEDHASGAKDDRPGLAKALAFLKPGDVLVVWKLDRLGRSLSHLLTIITSLKEKEVAFKSLTEGMDTTTPSGELLFHMFAALAQYERSLIQERVIAGLEAAKKRGRVGGRPPAITGEKLEAILEALKNGMSKSAACRNFGVKRTTLIETLSRTGPVEVV